MTIKNTKPALLAIAAILLMSVISLNSCSDSGKKTETEKSVTEPTTVAPAVEDTSIIDTLDTRPVKTPNK